MSVLETIAARLTLDDLDSYELAGIAQALIVDGYESRSLLLLAGTPAYDLPWEGRPLLERALGELGQPIPSRPEATYVVAREFVRQIVAAEMTPYDGAVAILPLVEQLGGAGELLGFAYLAYECEDSPEHYADYEADILSGAREFLAATSEPA